MVAETVGLSLKVETSSLKTAGSELDKFASRGVRAGAAATGFTSKVGLLNSQVKTFGTVTLPKVSSQLPLATSRLQKFTSGMKPAKNATQLVAFQVQDLAVQLSMGTSALVAFGQQTPQLASAFGPSGAVIGAIAGIGFALAGPLITAFTASGNAAKDFQSRIDGVRESLKSTAIEVNTGAIALLEKQIKGVQSALDNRRSLKVSIGGRRVTEGQRSKLVKDDALLVASQQKELIKLNETLNDLKRESNELSTGIKAGVQTDIPTQNFDSFNVNDYLFEQQAARDKAAKSAENTLIRQLSREDALWTAQAARNKKTAENEARFKEQVARSTLSTSANMFGQLSEIAAAGGEEQFTAYKRMAQAQAGIQAAMAILSVWGDPTIPFPLKIGATAVAGVATGLQIAKIEGSEYSAARENGGQVQAGTNVLVGERGPEVLSIGAQGGFVTPNHKMGGGESVTVVNQIGNGVSGNTRAEVMSMMPAIIAATSKAARSSRR